MRSLVALVALMAATPALAAEDVEVLSEGIAPAGSLADAAADVQERRPAARSSRSSGNRSTASSRSSRSRTTTTTRTTTRTRSTTTRRGPPPARPAARPPARPGPRTAARPAPRPVPRVVHHRTPAPPRVVHHRPPPRVVHARPAPRRVIVHRPYRPWHGVFVYGPRPVHHHVYNEAPQREVREDHLPDRKVDRQGSVAVGLRSGSYLSGYDSGSGYGDFGLGLVGRWRPEEAFGVELVLQHHDETWNAESERAQTLGQASAMLFANPWGRVQPYVLGGLSVNDRTIDDAYGVGGGEFGLLQTADTLWGPHAGVGVEFAFGQRAALDLEARYVGWMNAGGADPTAPGALQTNANFVVHF